MTVRYVNGIIKKTLIILLALALLWTSGCSVSGGKQPASQTEGADKQEITIGFTGATSFDSPYTYYGYAGCLKSLVFEPLVTLGADWTFQPLLAKSWDKESDTSYLFHLRDDIRFTDGTEVKAVDVKTSLTYISDTLKSAYLNSISSVEAVGEDAVRIKLKEPSINFFNELSGYGHIVKILGTNEKGMITEAIGTGPFVMTDFKKGQSITLERNSSYWQGKVKLEKVNIKYIAEPATVSAALESGQIDIADTFATAVIPNSDIARFQANSAFKVYQDYIRMVFLGLNMDKAPFNDIKVRQAVCYAVDKEAINKILSGSGKITNGPLSPSIDPWCDQTIKMFVTDPEKSQALLDEAGWKDSNNDGVREKDGKKLQVSFLMPPNDPDRKSMAESVQYQLAKIGMTVEIKEMQWTAISEEMKANKWDMVGPANESASGRVPPRWNFAVYPLHSAYLLDKDKDFHALMKKYETSTTQEEQVAAVHQIQQTLVNTYAFPFWYQYDRTTITKAKIAEFAPSPGEQHSLRFLWKTYVAK